MTNINCAFIYSLYLETLKLDDSYHFSYPFEYIVERIGDDDYETDTTTMEGNKEAGSRN